MVRVSLVAMATLLCSLLAIPAAVAQYGPSCAVPQQPSCAVPPEPCYPTCAVPSGCSSCGSDRQSCFQPQQTCCEPRHHGLFSGKMRPFFNWTKIEVNNRERCCSSQSDASAQSVPMMTYQPVQLQMTAYQPMMAAPQFIAAPQFVQAAPQMISVPQVQQVMFRPQAAVAAAPTSSDDCSLNNVCDKLEALKRRVDELADKVASQKDSSELERRVTQLEESGKLQTEILLEMKQYFQNQAADK